MFGIKLDHNDIYNSVWSVVFNSYELGDGDGHIWRKQDMYFRLFLDNDDDDDDDDDSL
jgi:hypothetical protein